MKTGDLVDLHGTRYRVGARKRVGSIVLVRLDAAAARARPRHVLGPEDHLAKLVKVVLEPRKTKAATRRVRKA